MQGAKSWWFGWAVAASCVLFFLTGCSRDPIVRRQKYLESGERYYEKGDYRSAAIQFDNAIQADSSFADAHYWKARTEMKTQDLPTALQEYQTTIQLNPNHTNARLELSKLFVSAGEFAAAKQQLDWLQQNQPKTPDYYLALADYDDAIKDTGGALAAANSALGMDSNRSDVYLALGMLDVEVAQGKNKATEQEWGVAEANLKQAVTLDPKSVEAQVKLGNFYQIRGRYGEAEQAYRNAIQIAPNDPGPTHSLANLFLAENKPQAVEDLLRAAKKDFPDNPAGYGMLARYYVQINRFDKALVEFASLYKEHPKDLPVKEDYIQLLILNGQLDDARKLNDEVLKAQPADMRAAIYKAQIETRGGKPSSAVETLQNALKVDPDNAIAHLQLGLAFNALGNGNRAEAEWREAIRAQPDMLDAHQELARAAAQRKDATALAQEADQIIALAPASPQGYLWRGMAETIRKQFPVAERFLDQAIEIDPNNAETYVQLGNLRMVQNQPAEALKAYQQGLDRDPNSVAAMGGVVGVEARQQQADKAIATLRQYLAKSPNNAGFHTLLGDVLDTQKHDLAGAEAEYRKAIELDKTDVRGYLGLAVVQHQRGDVDAALQTYLNAIQALPNEVDPYFRAGNIYEQKNDWDRAKQMYQKVLVIEPDNGYAANSLAYAMLKEGGNLDVAFSMAQNARRKLPDMPEIADTLGFAYYQQRVYASAIGLFQEAVRKAPENVLYNVHLGMAYARSGQATLARQQLDRVQRIKPNAPEAEDLRRAMAEGRG
jgi:tetratricopeptide (TPR) repeat protein